MEKCLITKLKGVADNDSLLKMGEARIKVSKIQGDIDLRVLTLEVEKPTTIYTTGEGVFSTTSEGLVTNPQTSYVMQPTYVYYFYFSNGDYEIHLDNKYSIIEVWVEMSGDGRPDTGFEIDIDDFSYSVINKFYFENSTIKGSLKSLENSKKWLYELDFIDTKSHGNLNIDDLPDKMPVFSYFASTDPSIGGDIIKFKNSLNLDTLDIGGSVITGELNDLAQAQYDNGRTSGSITVYGNGIITHNGRGFNDQMTITFNKRGYVIS